MSIKLFIYLFAFLFVTSASGVGWEQIIRERNFTETKSKGMLPAKVLDAMGVKHYSDIANPGENWNCCCVKLELLPDVLLNWAASDTSGDWVVSYSRGGFGVYTTVKLVPGKTAEEGVVDIRSLTADSCFTSFRKRYLEER